MSMILVIPLPPTTLQHPHINGQLSCSTSTGRVSCRSGGGTSSPRIRSDHLSPQSFNHPFGSSWCTRLTVVAMKDEHLVRGQASTQILPRPWIPRQIIKCDVDATRNLASLITRQQNDF